MAVGQTYKIVLEGVFLLQRTVNVFHYSKSAGSGVPDLQDFLDNFFTICALDMASIQSSTVAYDKVRITDEDPAGGELENVGALLSGGHTSSADLPPYACWSFLMHRATRQTFHGHKRLAGVAEDWNNNGQPEAGAVTAAADVSAALLSDITVGGITYKPCIFSRYLNGLLRPTPVVNFVDAVVFKGITTQNSRKVGHGS